MSELKQVFTTPDGKIFDNKKDAMDYLRRPKITLAMNVVTGNNKELTEWLVENQEIVEMAFETGTIRRVTKPEFKKLTAALEAIREANNPKFAFIADNADAVAESFRWPSVKRMTAEEIIACERNIAPVSAKEFIGTIAIQDDREVLPCFAAHVITGDGRAVEKGFAVIADDLFNIIL